MKRGHYCDSFRWNGLTSDGYSQCPKAARHATFNKIAKVIVNFRCDEHKHHLTENQTSVYENICVIAGRKMCEK